MIGTKFIAALSLVLVGLLPMSISAQPTISGELSGTLGPGEFVVAGDCSVLSSDTLTILPGTVFLFSGHYGLYVYGQLNADGTEADSIIFTRQFPTEECKHAGIRYKPGASMYNTLSYCRIEYADNPQFPDCWGGGILCEGAGLTIDHCLINNCRALWGGGLYAIDSEITISNCLITGCSAIAESGALNASWCYVLISDCIVTNNVGDHAGGIFLYTNYEATVQNCIIFSNTSTTTAG